MHPLLRWFTAFGLLLFIASPLHAERATALNAPGINWDKNRMMLSWRPNNSGDHIDYWLEISPQADFQVLHDSIFLNRRTDEIGMDDTGYYARISARSGQQTVYSDTRYLERYASMTTTDKIVAGLWLLIILAL